MFCPKCGKQISEGAKFCGGCGNPVSQSVKISPVNPANIAEQTKKPPKPLQKPKQDKQFRQEKAPERQNQFNLPSDMAMTQNTRDEERKNRKLTIILCIVLFVLVLVAAGMAIYYFKVLKNQDGNRPAKKIEESEDEEAIEEEIEAEAEEEAEPKDVEENPEQSDQVAEAPEEEEISGVTSETNEVVADTILENIPKAVYSYQFNETIGNAEVVVRSDIDTDPVHSDDLEPLYVRGIDGKAVYLDGTYGLKLSDVEKVGDSYTIAFWMKAERLCDWSPFIHIGYDLADPNKRVRLWLGQKTDGTSIAPIISSERAEAGVSVEIRPDKSMPNTIEPGVWYHIVFTVDASRTGSRAGRILGTLYVAGHYIGEGDVVPNTMNTDEFDVYLGINRWDELYPVAFDDVKIWDQVLNAQQVQELYDAY